MKAIIVQVTIATSLFFSMKGDIRTLTDSQQRMETHLVQQENENKARLDKTEDILHEMSYRLGMLEQRVNDQQLLPLSSTKRK